MFYLEILKLYLIIIYIIGMIIQDYSYLKIRESKKSYLKMI